jgi:thiamine-phosphate diphosphorylase
MKVPPFHLVTDDQVLERPDFMDRAADALGAGGGRLALHIRGPGLSGRFLFDTARSLMERSPESGSWILVNDRVDVALVAGTHGAHLGRRSMSVREVRRVCGLSARSGRDFVVGVSVHDRTEARDAIEGGADFLLVGTIFETPSHPGRAGAGPSRLSDIREACGGAACPPTMAIGGVTPERVESVLAAGAQGVAVLRGVWDQPDVAGAVTRYLDEMEPLLQ